MGTARKFRENAAELLRNGDMAAFLDSGDAETRGRAVLALARLNAAACGDAALQTKKHGINSKR